MIRNCRFLLMGALIVGLIALPYGAEASKLQKKISQPKMGAFLPGVHDRESEAPANQKSITKDAVAEFWKHAGSRDSVVRETQLSVTLRDTDDSVDLFDTFSTDIDAGVSFWGHIQNNDFGEDVLLAAPSLPDKTYVVDEIGFHYIPIASTAQETWARVRVWAEFNITEASKWTEDGGCTSSAALESDMIAEVVINLGADDNNECDEYRRYIVNLVDETFWDDYDEEFVTIGQSIVSSTSSAGYIPIGTGGTDLVYVTVEYGTDNGSGSFVEAAEDACVADLGLTGPGGRFTFRTISEDPDDTGVAGPYELWQLIDLTNLEEGLTGGNGKTYHGYHTDGGAGNNDGVYNCIDGIEAEGRPGVFWPPLLLLRGYAVNDCNGNGVPDDLDIAGATSEDLIPAPGGNGIPDDCDTFDCNNNDCWDICDVTPGIMTECSTDPYNTGCSTTPVPDCNNDGKPDDCQLGANDCNNNSIPDDCDVAEGGASYDCNENGIPEECEFAAGEIPDCNANGQPDTCDIDSLDGQPANSPDCDGNTIPDECQISVDSLAPGGPFFCTNGCSADCDLTGVPDICERGIWDCNANGLDDYCDIHIYGEAMDANTNNIPDLCELNGKTVMLDFEDKDPGMYPDVDNLIDWEYVDGPLNEQPIEEDAGDGSYFYGDWSVVEYDDETGEYVGEVTTADFCDAATETMGSSTRQMKFKTRALRPQVAATPHIFMADPNWEVVTAYTPQIQTITMDVMFEYPAYRVDWDLFVDSIFDDGDNAWNVAVGFITNDDPSDGGIHAGEIVIYHEDAAINTGVNWWTSATDVHTLKIEVDLGRTNGRFADSGKIYWNDAEIATFTPRVDYDDGLLPTMDRISFQNDTNELTWPNGSSYFHVDNIELYHSEGRVDCEAFLSDDCDNNGVCDIFDLQYDPTIDADGNGVIDECEWKCNDCNFNGIIDGIDIADGSARDLNDNGIIDWCEAWSDVPVTGDGNEGLISFNTSEGFVDGMEMSRWDDAAKHSGGWAAMGSASQAAISSDGSVSPTEGDLFFQIKADPTDGGGFGWAYGPRQQASDNDIEIWCWDMHVNQLGFDAVYVEIVDFCEDGADSYSDFIDGANEALTDMLGYTASTGANYPPVYAGVNTGVAIRGNDGLITFQEYSSATGAVTYEDAGNEIEVNQWGTFAIVVENSTGNTWLFYDPDGTNDICSRDLIGFEEMSPTSARPLYYMQYLNENEEAPDTDGDRQLFIRTTLLEEAAANVKFSFDNFRYLAFDDCDANSLPDEFSIESGQVSDHNSDGTPDNCQDCDNSCAGMWVWDTTPDRRKSLTISSTNAQACVDSFQITGANDCNGNGQLDACELDETIPYLGWEVAANNCDGTSPNVACWEYRFADAGCDADESGTLDTCEGYDDCNENGCGDAAEIAGGTALDVDENGVPDECMVDCNMNNREDALDIGQQVGDQYVSCDLWPPTSANDGIPDECCMAEIFPGSGLYEPAEPNPDFDGDGDIDIRDYRRLQECEGVLAGSVPRLNTDPPSCLGADTSIGGLCPKCHCGCADFNKDGAVDETDVMYFKLHMTGP